jgi:hypothetical protein
MAERKSFMFYLNWKRQTDLMSTEELRWFIDSLFSYYNGEEVEINSREQSFIWNGILPGLEANDIKYELRANASRENGSKSQGAPIGNQNASKKKQPKQPKQPVNSEEVIVNSEMLIVKGEEVINENIIEIMNNDKWLKLKELLNKDPRKICNNEIIIYENYKYLCEYFGNNNPGWEDKIIKLGKNQFMNELSPSELSNDELNYDTIAYCVDIFYNMHS